jgi:hypothetical protein
VRAVLTDQDAIKALTEVMQHYAEKADRYIYDTNTNSLENFNSVIAGFVPKHKDFSMNYSGMVAICTIKHQQGFEGKQRLMEVLGYESSTFTKKKISKLDQERTEKQTHKRKSEVQKKKSEKKKQKRERNSVTSASRQSGLYVGSRTIKCNCGKRGSNQAKGLCKNCTCHKHNQSCTASCKWCSVYCKNRIPAE